MRLYMHMLGIFLLGLVLLLTGCAGEEQIAEEEIEDLAPRYIGPADRYDANVEGLTDTQATSVELRGYGVRPEPNLVLQTLTLTFTDVSYQRTPLRITRIGNARFMVQVTDAAATNYLASQTAQRTTGNPIRNPQVAFLQDQVRITGTALVEGTELPLTTTGTLRAQGQFLLYQPQTITVGDIALTEAQRTEIAQRINPLFDLSRLTFEPQIQSLELRPGVMTIAGTADANRLLEVQPR